MITELSVENIAIIDRSQLSLGAGFTVLTGETGAGKSLLIDAIELALGERAGAELVRSGEKSGNVNVVLDLTDSPEAQGRCADLGIELDEGRLYISREVFAEGRSQCRINGRLNPVSLLKQIGQGLIDLHGQHSHQSLLFPDRHVSFLDSWIGKPAQDLVQQVKDEFEAYQAAARRLEELKKGVREREQRLDLLRFQIGEIEAVNPKEGESEEIAQHISRLQNVERLATAGFGAMALLADEEENATDHLASASQILEEAAKLDMALNAIVVPLTEALYQVQEATRSLSAYSASLEADPDLLDELQGRQEAIKRLRRKYGDDETAILEFLNKARQDLEMLETADAQEGALVQAERAARERLEKAATELSELRRTKAHEFASKVQAELGDLALPRSVFEVAFRPKVTDGSGKDEVEFMFSANSGELVKPLSKIASGGEISRVMLGLKGVLAGRAGVPTLIFDEVDTGLGGRAAATVGRKLEDLGKACQVIVISHLPQVAARAQTHFKIEKVEHEGRTVTRVRKLDEQDRQMEIARMLGGETVTDAALLNAKDLMAAGTVASGSALF